MSDGGALTWAEVSAELFAAPVGLDAGFSLEFVPTQTSGKWLGAVLTSEGDVLCIPSLSENVLRIAPNRQVTSIGLLPNEGWQGGVLLRDGGVLGLPSQDSTFLAVSATTALVLDAGLPRAGAMTSPYFKSGVITLSEHVLLAPYSEALPGVFDPASQRLRLFDAGFPPSISPGANYSGAVLLADGESAALVPRYAQQVMVVTADGGSLVGPNTLQGHSGGLLLPDGGVLLLPASSAEFLLWSGVTATAAMPSMRDGYYSAAWSTNGYGYALQTDGPNLAVAIIDRAGVVSEVPLAPDSGVFVSSHYGLVARPDGVLVGCPYDSNQVLFLVPQERRTVSLRTMTSPWLNKW